jgi:class 3 adenylate cyclase
MLACVQRIRSERERLRLPYFELRSGIHTGAVIAGTIGQQRFTYDVWGDAVNVAARIEAHGEPGRINVSEQVYYYLQPYVVTSPRGALEVKNKSQPVTMYFIDRLLPEYSADAQGWVANERLLALIGDLRNGTALDAG